MAMDDLTVKEAAKFLRVSEKTIYRWIRQGVIPTFKFQGQYRFDSGELEAWARYKRIGGIAQGGAHHGNEEHADILEALKFGGIHYKVEGDSREEIFRNAVSFFPFAANFPQDLREALVTALTEREAMVSTGVGHGIALPHPRHPRDWGLGAPAVGIFFLENPFDFKSFDRENVFVLFILLCASIKSHLKMLSLVSHQLNNPEFREFLATGPTRTDLMERIRLGRPKSQRQCQPAGEDL